MIRKRFFVLCFIVLDFVRCEVPDFNFTDVTCPYFGSRIDVNAIDQYQQVYVKAGSIIRMPCCQRYESDARLWFRNNRFLTENDTHAEGVTDLDFNLAFMVGRDNRSIGAFFCKHPFASTTINTYFYLIDVEFPDIAVVYGSVKEYRKYTSDYITPANEYISQLKDDGLDELSRLGLSIRVEMRWEKWSDCDPCKRVKSRMGHCHIAPVVLNSAACVEKCRTFMFALHMDCNSYWTINHVSERLSNYVRNIPKFVTTVKCVGVCGAFVPGTDYVRKLRTIEIAVGASVSIVCPGYATSKKFLWRRNGILMTPNEYDPDAKITLNEFGTLYITKATLNDGGNYTCYLDGKQIRQHRVVVREIYAEKSAAWWRHVRYLLYVVLLCFVLLVGGIAIACLQRNSFLKLKTEELIEMYEIRKFEYERLLPH